MYGAMSTYVSAGWAAAGRGRNLCSLAVGFDIRCHRCRQNDKSSSSIQLTRIVATSHRAYTSYGVCSFDAHEAVGIPR